MGIIRFCRFGYRARSWNGSAGNSGSSVSTQRVQEEAAAEAKDVFQPGTQAGHAREFTTDEWATLRAAQDKLLKKRELARAHEMQSLPDVFRQCGNFTEDNHE